MNSFLTDFNTLAYFMTFLIVISGVVAWRRVYSRAVSDVQDRVIATQKLAIDTLTTQVAQLTAQVTRLQSTLATVRYALKQQGIDIVIEDEYVVLKRVAVPKVTTVRLRRSDVQQAVEQYDSEESLDDNISETTPVQAPTTAPATRDP